MFNVRNLSFKIKKWHFFLNKERTFLLFPFIFFQFFCSLNQNYSWIFTVLYGNVRIFAGIILKILIKIYNGFLNPPNPEFAYFTNKPEKGLKLCFIYRKFTL